MNDSDLQIQVPSLCMRLCCLQCCKEGHKVTCLYTSPFVQEQCSECVCVCVCVYVCVQQCRVQYREQQAIDLLLSGEQKAAGPRGLSSHQYNNDTHRPNNGPLASSLGQSSINSYRESASMVVKNRIEQENARWMGKQMTSQVNATKCRKFKINICIMSCGFSSVSCRTKSHKTSTKPYEADSKVGVLKKKTVKQLHNVIKLDFKCLQW